MLKAAAIVAFCVACCAQVTLPRFEVASVKPSGAARTDSSGIGTGNGRLDAHNVTLLRCIIGAYGIGPSEVTGGPDWLDSDRFDISGKAETPTNDDAELMLMLRDLLADRFKLVAHREVKTIPVFVLEVARNGAKMKASEGDANRNTRNSNTGVRMDIRNTDMEAFAHTLAQQVDRPVVNRTGLKGTYSFTLEWMPERYGSANESSSAPSLFTAIQEQIGLRLRSERAPVEVLVIDSAEHPSEN